VATQLNVIASNDSSFPSVGRAIFTAEAIKEKINVAVVATRSTARLTSSLPARSSINPVLPMLLSSTGY